MADMQALLNGFLDLLMKAFPTSPFADTIEKFSKLPYLGYINWFVPVSEMVAIGSAWLLVIGVYYIDHCPLGEADRVVNKGELL